MANVPITLIFILAAAILVLLARRRKIVMPKNLNVGKCMTIGDREVQEDNFIVLESKSGTLLTLADGMGKAYGGKIASRIAVETFADLFGDYKAFENPQYYFRKAFNAANRAILAKVEEGRGSACVAAALVRGGMLYYALVGNIKIAIFRNGDLVPVSEGHTIDILAKQKYLKGALTKEQALSLLDRHRLYNFVGRDGFKDIEMFSEPLPIRESDTVALMSDGVYETLRWREIEYELSEGKDLQQQAFRIIERVNRSKKPNKDNASIVLYRF